MGLYKKNKFTQFLFHISFVVILVGAGITRYTGSEGTFAIREGHSSNQIVTDKTFFVVIIDSSEKHRFKVFFSPLGFNGFKKTLRYNDRSFDLNFISFVPNAVETIVPARDGVPIAEFIYADSVGRKSIVVAHGESLIIDSLTLAFTNTIKEPHAVILSFIGDSLSFTAPYPVTLASMGGDSFTTLEKYIRHPLLPQHLYTFNGQMIVLNKFFHEAKKTVKSVPVSEGQTYDAVLLNISSGGERKEVILAGKGSYVGIPKNIFINATNLLMTYGSEAEPMPFELKLDNFTVQRYPGSQSPSSFESTVTIMDPSRKFSAQRRIYMNNILKYRGYRFYQASYDQDEKGTILSVNHDLPGTAVSYAGYFLMALGMILSLFNPNSRFRVISSEINRLKSLRKLLPFMVVILLSNLKIHAQEGNIKPINQHHAGNFGRMLLQDNSGRIEPVNTLSAEVLRKISRKSSYKGLNSDQVFLGMLSNPSVWQHEPLIRASHPEIQKILGSEEKSFSFSSFFKNDAYILQRFTEEAFRKKPSVRTKFDHEIIKLDERINICYLVFSGEFLRIYPVPGDSSYTWYNHLTIRGHIQSADSTFIENILFFYIQEIQKSLESNDWNSPDNILNAISAYQQKYARPIIPSNRKVSMEIFLNKADVFSRISKYYGLIGFLLLILQFTGIFFIGFKLRVPVILSIFLIVILFCLHSLGMGLRWYVSGHAPWSNGYEALTYVAWATILAGLIFASKSTITLSVSSIVAFLILFVAHLSWMDPQITNLVPVLKSYWLVIHVATITASYGFLAMGAIVAFVNLLLMILHTDKTREHIRLIILELSNTIEMSLTIGLYLLATGVFLGAVWANESWGRYWGWDPKETWALITVLVYAFILHMRLIPGLKGNFSFNIASLLGFSSVIMTYFGVNYYLSGLHSYAKGDPVPVPKFVYYALLIVLFTSIMAYYRNKKIHINLSEE